MDIKAIQTEYKGYKFRSRLEARWAVFLDALGWDWLYEPEGYVLSDGTKYLPDFYLPELKVWIEVKAYKFTDKELKKCELFAGRFKNDECIMLADGLPEPKCYDTFSSYRSVVHKNNITITSYIRSKGWDCPYYGEYWDDQDTPAFDAARSARFEHGEKPRF